MRRVLAATVVSVMSVMSVMGLGVAVVGGFDANGCARRVEGRGQGGDPTHPDLAAVRAAGAANVDHGDYEKTYKAVIDDLNKNGGINGRKVVPVIQKIDPLGTAPSEEACLKFTEDDHVFGGDWFLHQRQPDVLRREARHSGAGRTDHRRRTRPERRRRGSPSTPARRPRRG